MSIRIAYLGAALLAAAMLAAAPGQGRAAGESLGTSRVAATGEFAGEAFLAGVKAYENGEYARAAESFLGVIEAAPGIENGLLFYNLGNAYFKQDDLGRAILWYERARRLIPRDPELRFNLELARDRLKDKQASGPNALERVAFFWRGLLAERTILLAALAANALFWGALGLRLFRKRAAPGAVVAALAAAVVAIAPSACDTLYDRHMVRECVALEETLPARAGFGEDAAVLFTLHAGTKARLEERRNDHARIRYAKDKIGWVPEESVAEI